MLARVQQCVESSSAFEGKRWRKESAFSLEEKSSGWEEGAKKDDPDNFLGCREVRRPDANSSNQDGKVFEPVFVGWSAPDVGEDWGAPDVGGLFWAPEAFGILDGEGRPYKAVCCIIGLYRVV